MIPAIQNRIDAANNGERLERDNHDQGQGHRVEFPASEIAELSELRKKERTRRAREDLNSRLLKVDEAQSLATLVMEQPFGPERPYGLPGGVAYHDIWEQILAHVHNWDDVKTVRNTCMLFRRLLEKKYKALLMGQLAVVVPKIVSRVGPHSRQALKTLLTLRRVSKASKELVDGLFLRDSLDEDWFPEDFYEPDSYWENQWVPKPYEVISVTHDGLLNFDSIMTSTKPCNAPNCSLHLLKNVIYHDPDRPNGHWNFYAGNSQGLLKFQSELEQLLDSAGSSIQSFKYTCSQDDLETFHRLGKLVAFMPNLVQLEVGSRELDWNRYNMPSLDRQLFPTCPKLRRFIHQSEGIGAPFLELIFRANPTISEVIYNWGLDQRHFQDFSRVLRALDSLQLKKFIFYVEFRIPPLQFLEHRFRWPLKSLFLTIEGEDDDDDHVVPTRLLFSFINSFSQTLEELSVTWEMNDTGGYLNVPKVSKLVWKLWRDCQSFDFIVALENLQYFDVDFNSWDEDGANWNNFISEKNLPSVFPGLRRIRRRVGFQEKWKLVWKP